MLGVDEAGSRLRDALRGLTSVLGQLLWTSALGICSGHLPRGICWEASTGASALGHLPPASSAAREQVEDQCPEDADDAEEHDREPDERVGERAGAGLDRPHDLVAGRTGRSVPRELATATSIVRCP